MKIIGLTGGIASGKNFVAEIFAQNNAAIFDADIDDRGLLGGEIDDSIDGTADEVECIDGGDGGEGIDNADGADCIDGGDGDNSNFEGIGSSLISWYSW
jgi:hypothetical protein